MKRLSIATISLLFFACSVKTDKLENQVETVQFHYINWACECANWATQEDIHKFDFNGDSLAAHCVFVEPADTSLKLPDTLSYNGDVVQFTGQYYVDNGLPKDYVKTDEPIDKAKVFRYTSYKIIESCYSQSLVPAIDSTKFLIDKGTLSGPIETLNLSYAAIGCSCAQWLESKNADDATERIEYYYLEPADSTLVNADTLFNGENLPINISVTGQFYLKKGYPKNYFPSKEEPAPARVFRYSKIKVLQSGRH